MNSHSYAHLIFDKGAKTYNGERQPLQQMLLRKLVICMQQTETSMFTTLYKYQLKMDQGP
jgi:hypothetical protein